MTGLKTHGAIGLDRIAIGTLEVIRLYSSVLSIQVYVFCPMRCHMKRICLSSKQKIMLGKIVENTGLISAVMALSLARPKAKKLDCAKYIRRNLSKQWKRRIETLNRKYRGESDIEHAALKDKIMTRYENGIEQG